MSKQRIILFDIETFPAVAETWGTGMYDQDLIRIIKPWELASFAYKELESKKVFCETREGEHTDKQLVKKLRKVLNSADVVIAHNGDKFDIKKSNTRIIKADLFPYEPCKTIDTLKIAKRHFAFTSNRLDDLADFLGVGRKVRTGGKTLWEDCRNDKPEAWRLMEKYNKHDVVLLERVYLKLRPWARIHPNLSFRNLASCPKCKSEKLQKRGFARTVANTFQQYQCQDCGGWCRARVGEKGVQKQVIVNG